MNKGLTCALAFILLLLISCGTMNSSIENNFPRKGFAFISKTVKLKKCIGKECATLDLRSNGSGYVVMISNKGAYIMTAAHVCDGERGLLETVEQEIKMKVTTLSGDVYPADVIKKDQEIDACLLFAEGLTKGVAVIPLASKPPRKSEKVYNIAAPLGVFDVNMVPSFEGRYAGREDNERGHDIYSIPATYGSSGSMILNSKGELVGMIHSVLVKFKHISVSSPFDKLMKFIKDGLADARAEDWVCFAPKECLSK